MSIKKSLTVKLEKEYGVLTFGLLLRSLRLDSNMDQKTMAKKLQIGVSSLSDLENGRVIPSPKRTTIIAKKLGHSPLGFIELSLSDLLRSNGLDYNVKLEVA